MADEDEDDGNSTFSPTIITWSPSASPTTAAVPQVVDRSVIIFALVGCALVTVLVLLLLRVFARPDTGKMYLMQVFISWWFGFSGTLVLLPLDIAASAALSPCHEEFVSAESPPCNGEFRNPNTTFVNLWRAVYWITFVWSWIVCPIVMDFAVSGEFGFRKKFRDSIVDKIKFYILAGVLAFAAAVLTIAFGLFDINQLIGYVFAIANIYGTGLIVVMIGYGMVEFPAALWRAADPNARLDKLYFDASDKETLVIDLREMIEDIRDRLTEFKRRTPSDDERLNRNVDYVIAKLPENSSRESYAARRTIDNSASSRDIDEARTEVPPVTNIDDKTLRILHALLKRALLDYDRAVYDWEELLRETAYLEKSVSNTTTNTTVNDEDISTTSTSTRVVETVRVQSLGASCKRHGLRAASVIAWISSCILLWCECTIPFNIQYSIYGALLHTFAWNGQFFFVQFASFLMLSYMCIACYTALFKFKLLDFLVLHAGGHSDVYALLGNAAYLGRLQFCLGFNFFSMIYDAQSDVTAFYFLIGDLADAGPLLGTSFNKYVPIVLAVFAISTFFNLADRILAIFGFETHHFPRKGSSTDQDIIAKGKRVVANARARKERQQARENRFIQPRGNTSNSSHSGESISRSNSSNSAPARRNGSGFFGAHGPTITAASTSSASNLFDRSMASTAIGLSTSSSSMRGGGGGGGGGVSMNASSSYRRENPNTISGSGASIRPSDKSGVSIFGKGLLELQSL